MLTLIATCSKVTGKPLAKAWMTGDVDMVRIPLGRFVRGLARTPRAAAPLLRRQPAPFAGPQLLALALQLAAGRQDVAPARGADGRGVAGAVEDGGEGFDRLPVRALVLGPRPGVEGDQVDLGRNALQQLDQRLGLGRAVVDALQ